MDIAVALVTPRQTRKALNLLFGSREVEEEYWRQRTSNEYVFEDHPFGLAVDVLPSSGQKKGDTRPRFIAPPNETHASVSAMKTMLRYHATRRELVGDQKPIHLRIVRVEVDLLLQNPRQCRHEVFFELVTRDGAFICGGCNDYTDQANTARKDLETLFHFCASLYTTWVETVIIQIPQGPAAVQRIHQLYDKLYHAARRTNVE